MADEKNSNIYSPDSQPPEKRTYVRINAEIRVFYSLSSSKLLSGYSVDLSPNGVYLVTTCPFDVEDNVALKLFIPGQEDKPISCDARVAWINSEENLLKPAFPAGVGLEFISLAPEDISSIVRFLDSK